MKIEPVSEEFPPALFMGDLDRALDLIREGQYQAVLAMLAGFMGCILEECPALELEHALRLIERTTMPTAEQGCAAKALAAWVRAEREAVLTAPENH
jgi:hypothetical protein